VGGGEDGLRRHARQARPLLLLFTQAGSA